MPTAPAIKPLAESRLITSESFEHPSAHYIAGGILHSFTSASPERSHPADNQDAILIVPVDTSRAILAIADGVGGHHAGAEAARTALHELAATLTAHPMDDSPEFRTRIIDGVEAANRAVLDIGSRAATTLSIIEINGLTCRPYHIGDSDILCMGQRGVARFQTVAHSPTGYAVEAGLIEPDEAMHHADRHIVSNIVGDPDMRIDIGPLVRLRPRDTILLGSDGLFDNLRIDEIIQIARCGPPAAAALRLARDATERMTHPSPGQPCKPDDLTFLMFRPRS